MPVYPQSDRLTPPQWVVACSVFGAMVLASLALGFSAGRAPSGPKARPTAVAEQPKAKPVDRPADPALPPKKAEPKTVVVKPPEPAPEPTPEPEKKTEPEPEMKKPEPKPEMKKPDPKPDPKKVEPKKVEPKKTEPPKKEPNPGSGGVTYVATIQKIVKDKCLMCHGDPLKKGGLDMKTLALMMKGGKGGAGVVPGKPEDSTVWQSIDSGDMPPSDKPQLTDAEKKTIHDWIMAGAKEK